MTWYTIISMTYYWHETYRHHTSPYIDLYIHTPSVPLNKIGSDLIISVSSSHWLIRGFFPAVTRWESIILDGGHIYIEILYTWICTLLLCYLQTNRVLPKQAPLFSYFRTSYFLQRDSFPQTVRQMLRATVLALASPCAPPTLRTTTVGTWTLGERRKDSRGLEPTRS